MLKIDNVRWKHIATTATHLAEGIVEKMRGPDKGFGRLEEMVQIIALKIVFEQFFPDVRKENLTDEMMVDIAQLINRQWIASKTEEDGSVLGLRHFRPMLEELNLYSENPEENPLNILLPVYETLWRVVLGCTIEVVFRPSANAEWREILKNFRGAPEKRQFVRRDLGDDGVSAEMLVNEALRLYPPTRRIYRQYKIPSKSQAELIAADIEACHRLPEIWGDESHKYQPLRWHTDASSMKKAFMPFGGKPSLCPAQANFGPLMIGVLVAALATILSPSVWRLEFEAKKLTGDSEVLDDDMELNSDRSEETSWLLKCKGSGKNPIAESD
ncbi:MAG: hypothetical protein Q9183_003530 [Haloplaca sp. 2 TL-2023]